MCKSGKDRTSMSLTLEHATLLHSEHGLSERSAEQTLEAMRRQGVRRENVRQNTGRRYVSHTPHLSNMSRTHASYTQFHPIRGVDFAT